MSQQNSSNMSQAMMHGLTGSQEFHQQQQPQYFHPQPIDLNNPNSSRGGMNSAQHLTNHHHMTTNNKIPDIIFTGRSIVIVGLLSCNISRYTY